MKEVIRIGQDQSWQVRVSPGDIILFSRQCLAMPPLAACICIGAKLGTGSCWDHVGIVVRNPSGTLDIVEANVGGITRRSLVERLQRTRCDKIAVRKLLTPVSSEFDSKLNECIKPYVGRKYNSSMIDMTSALLSSLSCDECRAWKSKVSSITHDADHLKNELILGNLDPPSLSNIAIRNRIDGLEDHLASLHMGSGHCKYIGTDHPVGESGDMFFCSQLVASVYEELGILASYRKRHTYTPSEFSSSNNTGGVDLVPGTFFSPDIVLNPRELSFDSSNGTDLWLSPSCSRPLLLSFGPNNLLTIVQKQTSTSPTRVNNRIANTGNMLVDVHNGSLKYIVANTTGTGMEGSTRSTLMHSRILSILDTTSSHTGEDRIRIPASSSNDVNEHSLAILKPNGVRVECSVAHNKEIMGGLQSINHDIEPLIAPTDSHVKAVTSLIAHLTAIQPLRNIPIGDLFEYVLHGSQIQSHNAGAILIHSKSSHSPLVYILHGRVRSSEGVIVGAGGLINVEALIGGECLSQWECTQDTTVLSVDRHMCVSCGLCSSSWVWGQLVGRHHGRNRSHKDTHTSSSFPMLCSGKRSTGSSDESNLARSLLRDKFGGESLFSIQPPPASLYSISPEGITKTISSPSDSRNEYSTKIVATSRVVCLSGAGRNLDYWNVIFSSNMCHNSRLSSSQCGNYIQQDGCRNILPSVLPTLSFILLRCVK